MSTLYHRDDEFAYTSSVLQDRIRNHRIRFGTQQMGRLCPRLLWVYPWLEVIRLLKFHPSALGS